MIGEAAHRHGVDPERISFIDAVRRLLDAKPGDDLLPLVVSPDRSSWSAFGTLSRMADSRRLGSKVTAEPDLFQQLDELVALSVHPIAPSRKGAGWPAEDP